MMGMKKNRSLLSPRSLIIHAIGIGAAVWAGKTWGEKTECEPHNYLDHNVHNDQ